MPDIFLSYSREDQATARRFARGLERAGFSVWWDQALTAGDAFDKVTEQALEQASAVVVLWSRHSVDSRWVRAEAAQAHARGVLVPVMIEPCKRPILFELTHSADLADWRGDDSDERWQSLVAGLRRTVAPTSPVASPAMAKVSEPRRPRLVLPLVLAAVLLGVASLWMFRGERTKHEATEVATPATVAPVAVDRVTLAVLPFADLSAARDQEYFSDGLTEEVLNQLAQVRGLRVTARTSSFAFKGKNEDVRDISRQLGVANLLEGSVRKEGRQLRITAQLVNGADGSHLWSKTYDRKLHDVFRLQEEVARDVAHALSVKLDVSELPRLAGGTTDVEAYDKYLRARELYHQGGFKLSGQSAQLLREAVALDPQFARAWLLLSFSAVEATTGLKREDAAPLFRESAHATDRVLELVPDAPWAQTQRALIFMRRSEWAQAEAALPGGADPTADYELNVAWTAFLSRVGRIRELVQTLEQIRLVDPLSFTVSADLQIALDAIGGTEQAQAEYERSRGLTGTRQRTNVYALFRELASKDATPETIGAHFRRLIDEEAFRMNVTHALASSYRDPQKARAAIRLAVDDPANQDNVRMTVVALYGDRFQEYDAALAALRKAVIDYRAVSALWLPYSSTLRSDPRFKQLLVETGLADYFRASGKWGDFCKPVGTDDFECR